MRQMASAEERQLCVRPSNWSGDGMRAMARRQTVPCAPGPASRCGCLLRYYSPAARAEAAGGFLGRRQRLRALAERSRCERSLRRSSAKGVVGARVRYKPVRTQTCERVNAKNEKECVEVRWHSNL